MCLYNQQSTICLYKQHSTICVYKQITYISIGCTIPKKKNIYKVDEDIPHIIEKLANAVTLCYDIYVFSYYLSIIKVNPIIIKNYKIRRALLTFERLHE